MEKQIAALAVILVALVGRPLHGQTSGGDPALERGNRSIHVGLSSGPQIGYWTRRTDRIDLGLDLFLGGAFSDSYESVGIGITPALKRYLSPNGVLAPYTYFGVPLGYSRIRHDHGDAPDTSSNAFNVGGTLGFGFDWLPVRQVSLGGHVGFNASYHKQTDMGPGFRLGTHSSGVRVHLYF